MQKLIGRKLRLFGHVQNAQQQKHQEADVRENGGQPHKEWLGDITEWGKVSLQELSQGAMDRKSWKS